MPDPSSFLISRPNGYGGYSDDQVLKRELYDSIGKQEKFNQESLENQNRQNRLLQERNNELANQTRAIEETERARQAVLENQLYHQDQEYQAKREYQSRRYHADLLRECDGDVEKYNKIVVSQQEEFKQRAEVELKALQVKERNSTIFKTIVAILVALAVGIPFSIVANNYKNNNMSTRVSNNLSYSNAKTPEKILEQTIIVNNSSGYTLTLTDYNSEVKRPDGSYYPLYEYKNKEGKLIALVILTLGNYDNNKDTCNYYLQFSNRQGKLISEAPFKLENNVVAYDGLREIIGYSLK
jgi:hypothetical protein